MPIVVDDDTRTTRDVNNKNDQNMMLRNCMAAGLTVSWFHSLDEDFVVVRVSGLTEESRRGRGAGRSRRRLVPLHMTQAQAAGRQCKTTHPIQTRRCERSVPRPGASLTPGVNRSTLT